MKSKNDLIIIGQILNSHGIKGYLKILPITGIVERFSDLKYSIVKGEKLEVESVFYRDRFVYLKFKEFNNINEILKFKNEYLYIEEEDKINLPQNTFFISDLIGLKVYDEDKVFLGTINNIIENPLHDIYEIIDKDNIKRYVPAIKEFVKKIDLNSGITIKPIKGMFE